LAVPNKWYRQNFPLADGAAVDANQQETGMPVQHDLLGLVGAFEDAANRHVIDEILAMFTDDAEFELVGLARLFGKEEIRAIFEYDAGVKGEIQLVNCTAIADTVSCQLVGRNDRLRAAGLDKMLYPSCVLSFTNGLIRSWRAVPDPEPTAAFEQFWRAVRLWIEENYAADYSRMFTSDGRFIRNRDNGERAVQLAREYRSSAAR
jgi:limonene-1,2-epoxide hydrolase